MKAKLVKESYWHETAELKKDYDDLYKQLVPPSGKASTLEGELLRNISRVAYDYFNNGFGNDKTPEMMFLKKYKNLFLPYMQDPKIWDIFYDRYSDIYFGDYDALYKEYEDSSYKNYSSEEDEYDYMDDNGPSIEDYTRGWKVDKQLDAIIDGIVLYILDQDENYKTLPPEDRAS